MKNVPFVVKYPLALSYLFSPGEARFILHMVYIEMLKRYGYKMKLSKACFQRQMNLNEYTFNRTVKKLEEMGLISISYNKKGTRVYYTFDLDLYEKLVTILSVTDNVDKLIKFCDSKFVKGKRTIDSITPWEIAYLKF